MGEAGLDIRTLSSADEMNTAVNVFQQVWGAVTPIVGVELLYAIAHAGGYVAGAFESGNLVGASFGFLAKHRGADALHSHVTGILPGVQHSGIGRSMKNHQRRWAADLGIPWITWTFDPLVRRNAWFNIEVLGAEVSEYLINFYGEMNDSINGDDASDRLVVAWATDESAVRPTLADASNQQTISTPDDIVGLRRTDPDLADTWRLKVRDQFAALLGAGGIVSGFTREGTYIVDTPPLSTGSDS